MAFKLKYNKSSFPFKRVVTDVVIKNPGKRYHEGKWGTFSTTKKVYEDEEPPPPTTPPKRKSTLHNFKISISPSEGKGKPLPSTLAQGNIFYGGSRYVDDIWDKMKFERKL
jgi:hypothetical protein